MGVPGSVASSELEADKIFGDACECQICNEDFTDEGWSRVVVLHCKHVLCARCTYGWVHAAATRRRAPKCPNCREDIIGSAGAN